MPGEGEGDPIVIPDSFVVEDGTGKSTATSYLAIADADTYHANITLSSDWSDATDSVKANALMVATQYLDAKYQGKWRGYRADADQALAWPRCSVEDDDGYAIDSDTVPPKLEDACAEVALRVVLGDDLLGVVTEPGEVTSETIKVGPISESKTYSTGRVYGYEYPRITALARGLIESSSRVYRG